MNVFPGWEQYIVRQKRQMTGCIPTGYEILLRAAKIDGIDFDRFQDEFDLEFQGTDDNHFGSVARAIRQKYPHVNFVNREFATGKEKLLFIEQKIADQQPVIVSVSNGPGNGWHIMPVVDADVDSLTLFEQIESDGRITTRRILKRDFVTIHDNEQGGKEVAFLER